MFQESWGALRFLWSLPPSYIDSDIELTTDSPFYQNHNHLHHPNETAKMASSIPSKLKDALPAHLKPGNGAEGERHHGKSQSHVVSLLLSVFPLPLPTSVRGEDGNQAAER